MCYNSTVSRFLAEKGEMVMIISPIIIIIVVAVLIATAVLYIINRPKKPIFTGVFLGLLLISVIFTMVINIELSATKPRR